MTLYIEHLEEEKCNNGRGRYMVRTAVALLRIQIIWDVMPCHRMIGSRYFDVIASRTTAWFLKGRYHAPLKQWEPVTHWYRISSQKMWVPSTSIVHINIHNYIIDAFSLQMCLWRCNKKLKNNIMQCSWADLQLVQVHWNCLPTFSCLQKEVFHSCCNVFAAV